MRSSHTWSFLHVLKAVCDRMWGEHGSFKSLFLSHWIIRDCVRKKIYEWIGYEYQVKYGIQLVFCDEKIAGLFICQLRINSVITVFHRKKEDVVVFLQNLFYTPRRVVLGSDIKQNIYFFMSQLWAMPYRCPLSCDSCSNERNIRKK